MKKLHIFIIVLFTIQFHTNLLSQNISQKLELYVETGHSDSVLSVAFSSDGKVLASGSSDNSIKLWNAETGKELKTLYGNYQNAYEVTFSPDNKTLASGNHNTIKLWNIGDGREIRTFAEDSDFLR